jgi:hypothetical protein
MSVHAAVVYRTSFNMFVPCDRETYRKLKRIRHLLTFAQAERRRWDRSQRRLPHNRAFKRRRSSGKIVRELVNEARMISTPMFELRAAPPSLGMPADARVARQTELHENFMHAYHAARDPKPAPEAVAAMTLTKEQIDALLTQIELWNLRR